MTGVQTCALPICDFRRDRPGDSFRGWLRGVTRFKLLERHRRRGRQVGFAAGGTDAAELLGIQAEDTDDDPGEQREVQALYLRALELVRGEVEARTWAAFRRVAVDAVPVAEVAAEMGVSAAAVRQSKSRVLRRLKEIVGDLVD